MYAAVEQRFGAGVGSASFRLSWRPAPMASL